jgi:hypothetical protein
MFTSITSHAGALVTAIVVLTGGAILRGGPAAADPDQDEQFLTLLGQQDIPALENESSLIDTAHRICDKLDGGMPVDALVDTMRNNAYNDDPFARLFPRRITRTMTRFITAAVEAYCPYDQSKIASIMANPAPRPNEPTHPVAAYTHTVVNSESDLREPPPTLDMINMPAAWQEPTGSSGVVRLPHLMDGGVFVAGRYGNDRPDGDAHGTVLASLIRAVPSGEITQPDPPQIPPPPTAQSQTPPRPIAAPPSKQAPPPPQQAPPPPEQAPPAPEQAPPAPQQAEPPAVAPPPGGAPGGAGPAEPSPAPPRPPGRVRLAP